MGKKKPSLKPVQRGIATISVASKKAVVKKEEEEKEIADQKLDQTALDASTSSEHVKDEAQQPNGTPRADGWEDEETAERFELQGIVDRLQEKAKKDVARIVKAIEFDIRLSKTFLRLAPHSVIRDRILEFALEEDEVAPPNSRPVTVGDKELSTTYISYFILSHLGFQEDRVWECLARVCPFGGWEECLEWLWLHCTEDECLRQGEYAWKPTKGKIRIDEALNATKEVKAVPIVTSEAPPPKILPSATADTPPSGDHSMFRSLDDSSDSEPDLDPSSINEKWASLRVEMDATKANAKFRTESAAITRLKDAIAGLEKEYLFDRKQADALYRTKKAQRHAASVRDRLQGQPDLEGGKSSGTESAAHGNGGSSAVSGDASEEESILGNLMDIAELKVDDGQPEDGPANTTITVKSMTLPTQSNFSAASPKAILQAAIKRYSKNAIVNYAKISGGSRAVRAGLEISFSADHIRVWRMVDIACENRLEAENYVATLALHELYADGHLELPNWRVMPPAYRDLWDELDDVHLAKQNHEDLALWKRIRDLLNDLPVAPVADPISRADPESVMVNGGTSITRDVERTVSEKVRHDFETRQQSARYQKMLLQRNQLPIAAFRQEILQTIDTSKVMVLSGETGCGKSTQLPSFILEQELAAGRDCKIIVTEPRRISAISLADRVSQELGDAPGAIDAGSSLVGYSIRLESKISASTKLAFVTNGIALRMLEKSTSGGGTFAFDDVTHIVVDEVHERSIESDFLLIALQTLIKSRNNLKIILMSATLDAEKLSNYFGGCPYLSVPGRAFPVTVNYLEDAVELCGWRIDEYSQYAIRHRNRKTGGKQLEWTEDGARAEGSDDSDSEDDPTKLSANRYSADTVSTVNLLDSRQIPYDLIVMLLEQICFGSPNLTAFSAAILVFLPGLAEIRKLNDIITSHPAFNMSDFVVYPLHSTISSEGQSAVFDIPPPGVRKIVLSTNIAETGVTIPDITCVIDSGKHREMRYDEKRQLSRLIETYISRSNAKQRRGRAGRVREGIAFHLFTKARHDAQMAEHPIPEMLRLSLQDLALRIKILDFGSGSSIEGVLSKALDPPSSLNIQRAIAALVEVKALNAAEGITPLGRLLSKLPLDVHLGKFLLVACIYRCLDPALTIVATLNAKSPFITPFGHESAADTAKAAFAVGNSDFLTLVNVFDAWRRVSTSQEPVRVFCRRNYLSQQNLQQIEESRRQLLSYLVDSGFVDVTPTQRKEISNARFGRGFRTNFVTVPQLLNENGSHHGILSSALAAGLYPRILSHEGKGALKSINNQQIIAIHPTSVNRRLQTSSLQISHMVYYTIMQSKRLYAWETGPVDDVALAILCGDQADIKLAASSLQIDRKIKYQVDGKSALAIKLLRQQLATLTAKRYRGSALTPAQEKWFDLSVEWLQTIAST